MNGISKIGVSTGATQTVTDVNSDAYDPQLRMATLNLSIVSLVDGQLQNQIDEQERSNERANSLAELRKQANAWKKELGDSTTALKDTQAYKDAAKADADDKAKRTAASEALEDVDAYFSGQPAKNDYGGALSDGVKQAIAFLDDPSPAAAYAETLPQVYMGKYVKLPGFDVLQRVIDGKGSAEEVNSLNDGYLGKDAKETLTLLLSSDPRAAVDARMKDIRAQSQSTLAAPVSSRLSPYTDVAAQWRTLAQENPNLKLDPAFADKIAQGDLKAADIDTMTTDLDTAFRNETTRSQEVQLEISRLQNLIKSKSEEFYNLVKSDTDMKQRIAGR
ncbi:MAG: hypothetical protein RLZZ153_2022 [Pseudomonadota bacterium]|jgi:hypothetical protein